MIVIMNKDQFKQALKHPGYNHLAKSIHEYRTYLENFGFSTSYKTSKTLGTPHDILTISKPKSVEHPSHSNYYDENGWDWPTWAIKCFEILLRDSISEIEDTILEHYHWTYEPPRDSQDGILTISIHYIL